MSVRSILQRWFPPSVLAAPGAGLRRGLLTQFDYLHRMLEPMAQGYEFGPIPGAPFPIQMRRYESGGLSTGVQDWAVLPRGIEYRIVFAGFYLDAGELTCDLIDGAGNSFLSAGPVSLAAGATRVDDRADFTNQQDTSRNIKLEIDSIDSGTPELIHALIVTKNVSKIEDV